MARAYVPRRMKRSATRLLGLPLLAVVSCHGQPEGTPADKPTVTYNDPQPTAEPPLAQPRAASWVAERTVDGAPLSLTASDGSGLTLAELRASAVVEGPLAFTEVHLAFDNPENRVREGTFKIVLPQGASLGRFAMKIGDGWQEGEVVAKERARRAYEDALHQRQDPALLERGAGNEFTARVFPIPPHGRKELIVSYAQELVGGAPYGLPLRGLPQLGVLDISVTEEGAQPSTMHREHFVPTEDFVAAPNDGAPLAVRSGNLVVTRVRPVAEPMPDPVKGAIVLVDTSASRALGLSAEIQLVDGLLHGLSGRLGAALPVSVAAFDQEVVPVYQGDARDFAASGAPHLVERRALGASDLEHALVWAREEAKRVGAKRVMLVTDAVPTAGEDDASKLAKVAASLEEGGVERLDVIAVGALRDDALASRLVTSGLAHDGIVAAGTTGMDTLVRRLEEGTRSGVTVAVEGASWAYPSKLDGVQPGDEALVYAELASPDAPLRVSIAGGAARAIDATPASGALVERGWAQAKIASLEAEEREHGKSPELEKQIVDLSISKRVLSAYTALLVLETDADYARFHIDRTALADILAVRDGRLAWTKHGDLVRTASSAPMSHVPTLEAKPGDIGTETASSVADAKGVATPGAAATPMSMPAITKQSAFDPMSADLSPLEAAKPMAMPSVAATSGAGGGAAQAPAAPRQRMADIPQAPLARASNALAAYGDDESEQRTDPFTGKFKQVKDRLASHDAKGALGLASSWQTASPGDVLALVALGEASEATGDVSTAGRAYGSIIDLFPSRADLRRFAGERLEHMKGDVALDLAIDTFDKARRDRPDHPASHRLSAFARVRKGDLEGAFDVMAAGAARHYPEGRFLGVDQILREDLGLIAAAWIKKEPSRQDEILAKLRKAGGTLESGASLRFVLNWETDANDVDFHIHDAAGGHAYYAAKSLPSGGELYADVTTGYGPECFTVRQPRGKRAGPYTLQAHYYSRGPMGYGMGKLEIIEHDGHGNLKFDERPFVIMVDHAFVDLGTAS